MSTPQQASNPERRIDLDRVRILAFALLIFYHVGMLYVSWGLELRPTAGLAQQQPA